MRVLLWALVLLVCGCSHDPATETADGPRIVSLSPAASIMLREAGVEGSIVGRHGWDATLDQRIPVAGDQTGLDYERLITLDPSHIVIEWGAREIPPRLQSLAAARGITLIPVETLTLEDIAASWQRVAEAFGTDPERIDLSAFRRRSDRRDAWGSVLLVVSSSPTFDCLGPGSAHHQLLVLAGFEPALGDGAPWVSLDLEDVIRLDPACIAIIQPGSESDDRAAPLLSRLGPLADTDVRAVRLGRVVLIDDESALIPSTNLAEIAGQIADKLAALGPLPSPP
ncbi:MAG: hypothetical protein AAF937_01660 [Planctomycetota bacterium]